MDRIPRKPLMSRIDAGFDCPLRRQAGSYSQPGNWLGSIRREGQVCAPAGEGLLADRDAALRGVMSYNAQGIKQVRKTPAVSPGTLLIVLRNQRATLIASNWPKRSAPPRGIGFAGSVDGALRLPMTSTSGRQVCLGITGSLFPTLN